MRRLKILMSAYSCEPGKGSESGIGWNICCGMAKHHDVWVLTRAQNQRRIDPVLNGQPIPGLNIVYYDVPFIPKSWDGENKLCQFHYPLWQLGLYGKAKKLHREIGFDIAHHVTWGRYWSPSLLSLLGIPFIWGPVGGGESSPRSFMRGMDWSGWAAETARDLVRFVGECDPFVRLAARNCTIAYATTPATAARFRALKVQTVRQLGHAALTQENIESLAAIGDAPSPPFRFISIGRLIHWKGFELAIKAFAKAQLPNAEYWIVGDGSQRKKLEATARSLDVESKVKFLGQLPRVKAMQQLALCHVLVHPSLHDSGGWACIEAMAAGRPVLCLDLGGPSTFVTEQNGIKVPATNPIQAEADLAEAMKKLADDQLLAMEMGKQARDSVRQSYSWERIIDELRTTYREVSESSH